MGFQDRHYNQESYQDRGMMGGGLMGGRGGMGIAMPRPTPVVKSLLIINIAVYVLQMMLRGELEKWLAASGLSLSVSLQVWRLVTFQFLHGGLIHLLFNMLGIYFLGPTLERHWGSKRFLTFYLVCGGVGGLLYVLAGVCFGLFGGTLIGASGGVLGLMVACAILFPQFVVILFIFPVPIRFAVVLFTGIFLISVLQEVFQPGSSFNAGGNLCHLGGMATGFVWVMSRGYFSGFVDRKRRGVFQRKLEDDRQQQYEVDRILAKVHERGIGSLSRREKQMLQKATDKQRHKTGS